MSRAADPAQDLGREMEGETAVPRADRSVEIDAAQAALAEFHRKIGPVIEEERRRET